MPAQKRYTPEKLASAVRRYFKSITREVAVTEKVPTGQLDKMGHMIYEDKPVVNQLGKELKVVEYLVPPTVGDLSNFLGIHRDTWNSYCHEEAFSDTTSYAQGCIHAYLEREMLVRSGKDLKGVLFNLENNFGYRERMELTNETMEDYLRSALEEGAGCQKF